MKYLLKDHELYVHSDKILENTSTNDWWDYFHKQLKLPTELEKPYKEKIENANANITQTFTKFTITTVCNKTVSDI